VETLKDVLDLLSYIAAVIYPIHEILRADNKANKSLDLEELH
jgi:hypothetical protein